MAITRDDIKKLGIDDADTITKLLDMVHDEIEPLKQKAEQYDSEKERADKLKADFDEQANSIEELKKSNGTIEELQGKIAELTAESETKAQEHEAEVSKLKNKLADTEFEKILDAAITKAGGRRASSVKAELNLDELKASKDRTADIDTAIKALKENEDTAFLFGIDEPSGTGVKVSTSGNAGGSQSDKEAEAKAQARAIMGVSVKDKE